MQVIPWPSCNRNHNSSNFQRVGKTIVNFIIKRANKKTTQKTKFSLFITKLHISLARTKELNEAIPRFTTQNLSKKTEHEILYNIRNRSHKTNKTHQNSATRTGDGVQIDEKTMFNKNPKNKEPN